MMKNKKSFLVIIAVSLFFFMFTQSFLNSSDKRTPFIKVNIADQMLELENEIVEVSKLYPLLDVDLKSNYTLALFNGQGYAIITNNSLTISEYALDTSVIPYADILTKSVFLVYGGPKNYAFTSDKKTFYNATTKETIKFDPTKEQRESNRKLLDETPKNPTIGDLLQKAEILKWHGMHETLFIRYNDGMWLNNEENYPIGNGICGPISTAILLSYLQDNVDPNYIPFSVRTPDSARPGNLIYLLEHHIGGSYTGTIALMIYLGLQQFLDSYNITTYKPSMTMLDTWDVVKKNVDARRPIAVGLTNWGGSPDNYGNHWVTVYAYSVSSKNKGYYKAIDNHGDFKARINVSWTIGAIWITDK